MKILSVRFQNLNSLKGEHEIRFDQSPLAEAGLFAITGPTGAGKTTILDAITVGLYGLVHRHSNDKPLELMTRHTAESFSEVEFEADSKRYRAKWHLRRSRGKVDGNIQPVHMELYSFGEDTLFDLKPSEVPGKVAELCGLDYNQFLRSVMLSQGDFARFLKANPNERSSLLEKITDTGIYSEISKFAYEKAKDERLKRDEMERRLQDTHLLPEEQRVAYEQSVKELIVQETVLQADIVQLQAKVQWLQQVAQLQAKQEQQHSALQVQEQKLAQLQPEFIRLKQHEQAHQFVGELAEIRSANSKVAEVHEELQTLQKRVPALETELEAAGKIASEATKAHQQQEEALQKLEPLLAQVARLDHQLNSIRESYSKNKTAYVTFEQQLKQEQAQLQAKQLQLDKLTQEATEIKNWLEQNAQLQDLKEHLPEFKATLRDLQEAEQRIKRNQQEQQELNKQRQQEAKQLNDLQLLQAQQQTQQEQLHQQKEEKLTQLKAILSDKSMEELEQTAQSQPALVAKYERLQELAQQHTTHTQKLQNINELLEQHTRQAKETAAQLEDSQAKYKQAEDHLQTLQKLVQLQQQIQQYEEARHTLVKDEPCPLCGSTHHPFADNGYAFDLPEEVQKRDKQQVLVKELEKSIGQLQLQQNALDQKQQVGFTAKSETEKELQRLNQLFEQLSEGLPHTVHISDIKQLQQLCEAEQKAATALQQQLAQARNLSRDLENLNQQVQKLREAQVQAQATFNQLQQSDKLLHTQLQKLQSILTDEQEQQQVHTETAESFAASFGLKYKPEERHTLLQTLEQQSVSYAQKQQALESMREKYIELKELVKNLKSNVQQKGKELEERKQVLKEEHEQLTQLKTERHTLFGEKETEQERKLAQQELKVRAQQAEEARRHQLQKQQELQETRARQADCRNKHQQNKSVLDELREGLLHVLQQKGIETIEALSQMLLHRDEADRLANLKAQTEKHLTELRKSVNDVQQELAVLQEKQLTEESMEVLQGQHQQKTEQQRELISQRARHEQLLEQDAQQREKNKELAELLKTQQLVCNRWSQLADLIGSADGNKFSRFAQGLTLARLVELANHHLQKLNDRYRILKSSTEDLELLILDLYQAEAVRPMNTLSGGESFLVSLALALGLSDLAGRRTQINSLFIDEGFGTLDADTLDAAISTLENLQASGKMIGIISHVEALKERISTQIKVQRQPGGVSKVEVVGW
ncbi:SbcC/MukB-like Walker B domain-containing protein [Pontibacter korlensis]|uniref:DNA repair ATPase n=1 Tax=Pontibacter korlensis TaxID=400092 RepID=A0A0E3UYN5_9BACT|nr:SbcC/MukB-like Walker B domain-containing protein [Pontibacter korlensis]AKD05297.1 DNA repair ATPase [Pontibacter korlensis]